MTTALATRKVLVLNRGWNPIAVIGLERAMCLIVGTYKNNEPKARVLDPTQDFKLFTWADWGKLIPKTDEAVIHGVSRHFRIPEIILLSRYKDLPQQRIHFSRRTIYKRDGNQCMYCGARPGLQSLSIDHVTPRSRGGLTVWENTVLACVDCNRKKANRLMAEAGMKFFIPGYKPIKPKFTLYRGDYRCDSWQNWLGTCYWNIELVNDN
jgi:5-methylcytosine-specific restriction endonuclease McrA